MAKNVMNREKIAETLNEVMTTGVELLKKEKFSQEDHTKLKVMRTLGPHINAAVGMVQQETAQARLQVVLERMKQLGYTPKEIE